VIAQAFDSSDQMRAMFELVKADHDDAQGAGYWKTHFAEAFDRSRNRRATPWRIFARSRCPP
jgi:hypothetical protein